MPLLTDRLANLSTAAKRNLKFVPLNAARINNHRTPPSQYQRPEFDFSHIADPNERYLQSLIHEQTLRASDKSDRYAIVNKLKHVIAPALTKL